MSQLAQAKMAAFTEKLGDRARDPEFQQRQADHKRLTAAANAELTALLAEHKAAGTVPTEGELKAFPSPSESPMEALSREIYGEIAVNG